MGLSKLTVYTILLSCLLYSVPAFSQQALLISIKEKDVTLSQVLSDLRDKYNIDYMGTSEWTQSKIRINISVTDMPLDKVMDHIFFNLPFNAVVRPGDNMVYIYVRPVKDMVVHGLVMNEKSEPLEGVSITVEGDSKLAAVTSNQGLFALPVHYGDIRLVVSYVNYETRRVLVADSVLRIVLKQNVRAMEDVVVLNNGYQQVRSKATTGSYDQVDKNLISRRVSPSLLDRIDGVASGVLFNKNTVATANPSAITIRGRSTIFANPNPLIVIDNFPYAGDLNNINPDDVENITILKDAAAASIWGAFSGNGVIVITTKKGRLNSEPRVSFNTSQTVAAKPDLYYQKIMSSKDYIEVENTLFQAGYYDVLLNSPQYTVVSPVVDLLNQVRTGTISKTNAMAQIDAYRQIDGRQQMEKYFYQHALNSQYSLNVSGGGTRNQYYFSGGYDRDLSTLVRNEYNRITLNANNIYQLFPDKLEFTTGFAFTSSNTYNNNSGINGAFYPYAQVADAKGNALPVAYKYRQGYVDTAGNGNLLDWHYYPLEELRNSNNKAKLTDYRVNIGLKYIVFKGLSINGYYQLGHGVTDNPIYYSTKTWTARDLINTFAADSNGTYHFPIPQGGMLQNLGSGYTANNGRVQINFTDSLFKQGRLNVIGGAEVRDIEGSSHTNWYYGYDPNTETFVPVNYNQQYTNYITGQSQAITYKDVRESSSERYISYYINADYTYRDRYILSASGRRDESNLFGVKANQKGVPLWSVGGGWILSKEDFYQWKNWMPYLKLRVTDGYNGNVDRSLSAFTTANINPGLNGYSTVNAYISNPANPNLRWERINTFDAGVDFEVKNGQFTGSVDYYIKSGQDLIGKSPIDPTVGIDSFTSNAANMVVHGIDFTLHNHQNFGPVQWNSVFLFSIARDRVTVYKRKLGSISNYLDPTTINPLVGHPLYSVYALKWRGLNPLYGDPQGVLNGQTSMDWGNILGSTDFADLIYKGPVNPPYFGSWRNDFGWHRLGFSFNIVYKFGYVFRRPSIFYSQLFEHESLGHPDYEKRWQQPGDEHRTNVPSMLTYDNTFRDQFYQNSEVLIEKGDHIRWQDIQLTYDWGRNRFGTLPVQNIRFYIYMNNIGIIWKANHAGIDPDYQSGIPNPRTFAGGVKVDF